MYQMEEMPNEELDDNEYMTKNLIETVTLLCRNNLKYNFELKIQGLLAITTDNQNVIVVQINEALPKKGSSVTGHHMGAGNNMMDCNLSPPQTRGLGGNVPNVSGMARGMPRAALGRGRLVRRGTLGNSQRMKAPAVVQNQMAARARIRQQLQFTTPQKRPPPSMMRSPGSAPIRAPRPQPSPHHQVEDGIGAMVPYEAPPARRTPVRRPQAVRPKVELVEGDEAYSTPKRPIKREASNCQQSSEVCVLSDEEEFNPPTLKAEIDQSPLRKRHMPVLSCEVDGEGSAIIQASPGEVSGTEKAVGSQRIQVKSESVPSVEVETMKEELEWPASGQWQESSSQQHCCSQCGSVFHNMRGLRQHMRNVHPGGTSDNARVLTVGSVVSSPASSTSIMHSGTNQRCEEDLGEVI